MLFDLPQKTEIRAIQKKMVEGMNIANLWIAFDHMNRPRAREKSDLRSREKFSKRSEDRSGVDQVS
jgi:hypothetical protein